MTGLGTELFENNKENDRLGSVTLDRSIDCHRSPPHFMQQELSRKTAAMSASRTSAGCFGGVPIPSTLLFWHNDPGSRRQTKIDRQTDKQTVRQRETDRQRAGERERKRRDNARKTRTSCQAREGRGGEDEGKRTRKKKGQNECM